MARRKVGLWTIVAIEIQCPYCQEHFADPNDGSHIIKPGSGIAQGDELHCDGCGSHFFAPAMFSLLDK